MNNLSSDERFPSHGHAKVASSQLQWLASISSAQYCTSLLVLFLTFLVWEQYSYRQKKAHLPGATWTLPIIGKLKESLWPKFTEYIQSMDAGPMTAAKVFNRFIILIKPNGLARKVLGNNEHAEPFLVNSARKILKETNWVFLQGKAHLEYRRLLNPLFTRTALSRYIPTAYSVVMKHFELWKSKGSDPRTFQWEIRELNMDVSLEVFCGSYLTKPVCAKISQLYYEITLALELVNFPFAFPGTKVYRATKAREYIIDRLIEACQLSRAHIASGGSENCMLDSFIKVLHDRSNNANESDKREFSDEEVSLVFLSFIFASQDATTSAITWAFRLLSDHPDVLLRIRKELAQVRGLDNMRDPLTLPILEQCAYLRRSVKEMLRFRPPVLMVPYRTTKKWPISPDYTVPANTMLIPTFWHSLHDEKVYANPEKFDPDRWEDPEGSAERHPQNFIVFGAGHHYCIGREYATLQIMSAVAAAAAHLDWKATLGPKSDEIAIIATTYPGDGCELVLRPLAEKELFRIVSGEAAPAAA